MASGWFWVFLIGAAKGTAWLSLFFLHRYRQHGRKLYQQQLERALEDGILTADELQELQRVRARRSLGDDEVRMVAIALYRRALRDAAADARITEDEAATLERLRMQLGLKDADLQADRAQLQRVRILGELERGKLPVIESPVKLANGELCHWVDTGTAADQMVLPGRRFGLQRIPFIIDANPTFSAQGPRDELRPSAEILPNDLGMLLVTNRRALFQGARRSMSVPHSKLRTLHLYRDGVGLDETDPTHTSFFLLHDPELTAAIILAAAQKRQNELLLLE